MLPFSGTVGLVQPLAYPETMSNGAVWCEELFATCKKLMKIQNMLYVICVYVQCDLTLYAIYGQGIYLRGKL